MRFARRTNWELRPNRFSQALDAHFASGKRLLDLTASNPPEAGLRYDSEAILSAFNNPGVLEYHPAPKGLLSARCAVAEYYAEVSSRVADTAGVASCAGPVSLDQIVLTTSTSEAYTYAFRLLCDPGDEVLIPTPSYPLFEYLAGLQDVRLVPYDLFYDHGWQIDFYSLTQAITPHTRAVILVNPNNPTGSYVSTTEAMQLNAICRERDMALIVDEVFLDYTLNEPKPSFAFNTEALTFTLSGVSKISGLPQMKLAWAVVSGPEEIAAGALSRIEVIADTYLSMSAPIQYAAPVLLQQRQSVQGQLSSRVRTNLEELDRQTKGTMVSRLAVEGGWYAILRIPRLRSDEEFVVALLEREGVLVQPGYFYDFRSEGFIVVSLITPEQIFSEGLGKLLRFLG
ncbi:MAG TPA: pyridoxal phosphate-dependent aminotransferase [Terriglobales bacterium]|nr:pyridoxal phosphate-dependent aminotransferase [Terriglobales bacterium]